tara:strand:- start:2598 stop:2924 length:327 start_codon:yes stop_codon:yes gene_type:complete
LLSERIWKVEIQNVNDTCTQGRIARFIQAHYTLYGVSFLVESEGDYDAPSRDTPEALCCFLGAGCNLALTGTKDPLCDIHLAAVFGWFGLQIEGPNHITLSDTQGLLV